MSKSWVRNKSIKTQLQEYTYYNIFRHFLHNKILGIVSLGNVDHLLSKSLQGKEIHFHPKHAMTELVDKKLLFYPICLDVLQGSIQLLTSEGLASDWIFVILLQMSFFAPAKKKMDPPNASVSIGRSNAEHFKFPIFIYSLLYSKASNYKKVRTLDIHRRKAT